MSIESIQITRTAAHMDCQDKPDTEFQDVIDALGVLIIEDELSEGWGTYDHTTGMIVLKTGLGHRGL